MKNVHYSLLAGVESTKGGKLSLLHDTRVLLTTVALSAALAMSGCGKAQAADGAETKTAGVINASHSVPTPELPTETRVLFTYVPSTLGMDYHTLTDSKELAAMLSQGETEWLKNAYGDYEEDTAEAWKSEMVPELVTGAISNATVEEMREYTPKMLSLFGRIPMEQKKYHGIQSEGLLFNSEKIKTAFDRTGS